MPTITITIPEPSKIGGHRDGCSCIACERVRARLLKSPYVQTLRQTIADLIASSAGKPAPALPRRWASDTKGHFRPDPVLPPPPAPQVAELEARVIALTTRNQELENGNELLRGLLDTSEKTSKSINDLLRHREYEIKQIADLLGVGGHSHDNRAKESIKQIEQLRAGLDEVSQMRNRDLAQWDEDIQKLKSEAKDARKELADEILAHGETMNTLREVERQAAQTSNELTLSGQRIEELEKFRAETYNSLQHATGQLQTKTYELACLKAQQSPLPRWAQYLAAVVLGGIIAAIAHRSGFEAGQGWTR